MVTYMKDHGSKTRLRVKAFILIWMEHSMKESGNQINNMDLAKKVGLMEPSMKVNTSKERNMA